MLHFRSDVRNKENICNLYIFAFEKNRAALFMFDFEVSMHSAVHECDCV